MRVLHLPRNIASILSHQVRAERRIGIDAVGVVFGPQSAITSGAGIQQWPLPRRRDVPGWFRAIDRLRAEIRGANLVHWYFGRSILPLALDVLALAREGRPGVVEFLGSDIRIPEVEFLDNPYYEAAYRAGYEYAREESRLRSHAVQHAFLKAGLVPVVPNGLIQYLTPEARRVARVIERAVVLDDYPVACSPSNEVPVVVHAPSAPVAKGTESIEKALATLRDHVTFEYVRVHGMRRAVALETIARADVVIDQVVLGDYGMAAIEAMAMGKPVVAWIKPAVRELYPPDLPVVNATSEELPSALLGLLTDPEKRQEIGAQSRAFVERYHNAERRASVFKDLYQGLGG